LTFYFAGLATTMAVMHTFKAAQPALLYLSPACILSTMLVAAVSGELSQVFKFTTEKTAANIKEETAREEPFRSPKKTRRHVKAE
jgi:minor histocompatibility antigen H13